MNTAPKTLSEDLLLDVSDTVDLGEPANVAATVHLPDPADIGPRPIVCFAKPGGAYSKGYFTENLPPRFWLAGPLA